MIGWVGGTTKVSHRAPGGMLPSNLLLLSTMCLGAPSQHGSPTPPHSPDVVKVGGQVDEGSSTAARLLDAWPQLALEMLKPRIRIWRGSNSRTDGHCLPSGAQRVAVLHRPALPSTGHHHQPHHLPDSTPVTGAPPSTAAGAGRRSNTWRACGMIWPSTPRWVGHTRTLPAWLRHVRPSSAFISADGKLDSRMVWRYSDARPLQGGKGRQDSGGQRGLLVSCGGNAHHQTATERGKLPSQGRVILATYPSSHPSSPVHTPHLRAQSRTRIMSTPCPSLGMRFSASNTAPGGVGQVSRVVLRGG